MKPHKKKKTKKYLRALKIASYPVDRQKKVAGWQSMARRYPELLIGVGV